MSKLVRGYYVQAGPFMTASDQWDYVLDLAAELHAELVDLGAGRGEGPQRALAEAVAKFVQGEPL